MNPAAIMAWVQVAQVLAGIGVDVAHKIDGLIHHAQPTLTPEERKALLDAVMADDSVRAALAQAASLPGGDTGE